VDRRWILSGLLLAGGIGVARMARARPKLTEDTRLLLIGDSLAQGLSPHLKALATDAGLPYLGAGVAGSRVAQWIDSQWLSAALQEFSPNLVLLCLGTNDAYSNLSVQQERAHVDALLARLPAQAEVVWVGPPLLPATYSGRAAHVELVEAIADRTEHYYDSQELDIPRGPDGLHPTAAGYAGWAGALWDWLD
jgi:lysophospholipase L1-like esterase